MTLLRKIPSSLLAIGLYACSAPIAELTDADRHALKAASREWVALYNQNDWPALAEQFTPDAVMMPPNSPAIKGRQAIAAWEAANESGFQIAFQIESIKGRAGFAAIKGRSCVFMPRADGGYDVDVGKFLETRVQQDDGRWLMEFDAFNSDSPQLKEACPFSPNPPATQPS